MEKVLGRFSSQIYAIMRIVVGFLFFTHGAQKIFGIMGGFGGEPGNTAPLLGLMGAAGIIELAGGLLIMLGFFTSTVAFITSGEMAVAYFMAHAPRGVWPLQQGGGETALLYAFLFLFIASRGSGIWSIDAVMSKSGAAEGARASA